MSAGHTEQLLFKERVYPSAGAFSVGLMFVLMLAIAYGAAINLFSGLVLWIVGTILFIGLVVITSPVHEIRIEEGVPILSSERATSPIATFSQPILMDASDVHALRHGSRYKTAFGGLRGKLPAVLLTMTDPDDPHEAWILATRQPERLLRVLASLDIR